MAMPMADSRLVRVICRRRRRPAPIARTHQRRLQFLFDQGFGVGQSDAILDCDMPWDRPPAASDGGHKV